MADDTLPHTLPEDYPEIFDELVRGRLDEMRPGGFAGLCERDPETMIQFERLVEIVATLMAMAEKTKSEVAEARPYDVYKVWRRGHEASP